MPEVNEREKELTMLLNSLQKNGLIGIAKMASYSFSFKEHFDQRRFGEAGMYLRIDFSKVPELEKNLFVGLQHRLSGNFELTSPVTDDGEFMIFRRPLTENYLNNKQLQSEAKKYAYSKITQAIGQQGKEIINELTNIGIKDQPQDAPAKKKASKLSSILSSMLSFLRPFSTQ